MSNIPPQRQPNEAIDLGLAVISCLQWPGQCLSAPDIADICGYSPSNIYRIERLALRKIRKRLREQFALSYDGLFARGSALLR